jgi:non-ribosomal peptide synthetase component F
VLTLRSHTNGAAARAAPVSSGQERLWFLDRLAPGSSAYNVGARFRVRGELDLDALAAAVQALVARHETLRTTFSTLDGVPVQLVQDELPASVCLLEVPSTDRRDREAEVERLASEEIARPFDLEHGPLLRVAALRVDAGEHLLVLTVHHIAADGASLVLLLEELGREYEAAVAGVPSGLEAPALTYREHAARQRARLRSDAATTQLAYWRSQLEGAAGVLTLPLDRPRPAVPRRSSASVPFALPSALVARARELGRREGASFFMVLLAAFDALVHRYTEEEDVAVGTLVSGRPDADLAGVVGFFANTLVLRTAVSPRSTFRQLLGGVRETCLDAYDAAGCPFDVLVDELRPARDLSHAPLVQLLIVSQQAVDGALRLPGLEVSALGTHRDVGEFDLALVVEEGGEAVGGAIEYDSDLFTEEKVRRFATHLEALLGAALDDPDARLSGLPLLTAAEERRLDAWNPAPLAVAPPLSIPAAFAAQAARTPDSPAVAFRDARRSYAELDERASRIAGHLARLGVGRGDVVGVCLGRDLDLPAALLGIVKAGAAYLPLDPEYPARRLAYMASHSGAVALVSHSAFVGALPAERPTTVLLDVEAEEIAAAPLAPEPALGPEDLAYVIYTSGSTGQAKGVAVTHGNVASLLAAVDGRLGVPDGGAWLTVTSISFDMSVLDFFWPLTRGLTLVVQDVGIEAVGLGEGEAGGRAELAVETPTRGSFDSLSQLARHSVSHLQATPGMVSLLAAAPGASEALQRLEAVLVGGEAFPPALARALGATTAAAVWNMYGPTEATVWATAHRVDVTGDGEVPLGRPLGNSQIRILDAYGNRVPVGVPGEICIAGGGVARGYWRAPALTAERFVPDPYGPPGTRMYRTGDHGRYLADGTIAFLGRRDGQLKLRGFRIELGEIEAELERDPLVERAVAVVSGSGPEDAELVAYVRLAADAPPAVEHALRERLREALPAHMIPRLVAAVASFPLTPNGKVDRRRLSELADAQPARPAVPPRTPLEREIADAWRSVLDTGELDVHENFFDAGGNSIRLVQVLLRLRQTSGHRPTVLDAFVHPTIASLAAHLERSTAPVAPGRARAPATR